jgi:hypothetical protein
MDSLKKYYSSMGIWMLDLFESLEKDLKKEELSGLNDPKRKEKFEMLEMTRNTLTKIAGFRKEMAEKQKIADQIRMEMRTNVNCQKCKTMVVANIIGEFEGKHESGVCLKFDILQCPLCNTEFENETPNNWPDILTHLDLHIDALKMIVANPKKYPMNHARKQDLLRAIKSSKTQREMISKPFDDLAHDWKIVEEIDKIEKEIYDDWNSRIKSGFLWVDLDVPLN